MIGKFNKFTEKTSNTKLDYYSKKHSAEELKIIFDKTKSMMAFFEEKSGIKYYQPTYSQIIIIGEHYQEMSGLSVLKSTCGGLALKNGTETNLISHELAHQWWGNRITCKT